MRTRMTATAIVLGVATLALIAAGTAVAKTTQLQAELNGASEVPGPGDPDATGTAGMVLKEKPGKPKGTICFVITFQGAAPIAGHIHQGAAGTDGPIVVPLFESAVTGPIFDDCVKAKRRVVKKIAKSPEGFYVNLHSDEFPGGAIRGQLIPSAP
jgi:CHRD domain